MTVKENSKTYPIIHVGYPKTATTWFQELFYPNVKNYIYVSRQDVIDKILDKNAFEFNPTEARSYFDQKYGKNIIICEERIIADLRNKGIIIKENAKRIKAVFPEAQIVIFIRNQLNQMASKYSQYVKAGGSYGINKYLYRAKNQDFRIEEIFSAFLYDRVISFYYSLFGKSNVSVFLYEDFSANPQDVVDKIINRFHLQIERYETNRLVNSRLRFLVFYFLRFLNCFTRKRRIYKYYLIHIPYLFEVSRVIFFYLNQFRIFGKPLKTKKILGKKNIDFIKKYYRASNKNLIDKYQLFKIKEYSYPL